MKRREVAVIDFLDGEGDSREGGKGGRLTYSSVGRENKS
jgi:hypothetical protein